MGVMLSLDRSGPVGNHRRARHARRPGGQARSQALAVMRRDQASASNRLLSRLTRTVLARRNRSHGDMTVPPATSAVPQSAAQSATPTAGSAAGRAPAA
jgi:hypothetical protein